MVLNTYDMGFIAAESGSDPVEVLTYTNTGHWRGFPTETECVQVTSLSCEFLLSKFSGKKKKKKVSKSRFRLLKIQVLIIIPHLTKGGGVLCYTLRLWPIFFKLCIGIGYRGGVEWDFKWAKFV